jgi:hypothetical protein
VLKEDHFSNDQKYEPTFENKKYLIIRTVKSGRKE